MKKLLPFLLLAALLLSACAGAGAESASEGTRIVFDGGRVQITGGGAREDGAAVVIAAAGIYTVSGTGSERQLVIDTGDDPMDVTLILDGADLSFSAGAVIHVRQAGNFRLQLAEGSENRLVSGTEELLGTPDPNASGAALLSEDDMDIEGGGSLAVFGYLNNGIACKDDLDINSGSISVVAANHGVRGNDSVEIKGGSLSIRAGGDGIKASTADKQGKGFVALSGGEVSILSGGDGVQAATDLRISGGRLSVTAQGDGEAASSKGLKADGALEISGGSLALDTQEDGLRAASLTFTAGELTLSAGGDGIQTGVKGSGIGDVTVSGGSLQLCTRKQAVQAEGAFTVTGGSLRAVIGSDKQQAPESAVPFVLCLLKGAAGETVGVDGLEGGVTAAYNYKSVLWIDGALPVGGSAAVGNGSQSVSAAVR